MPAGSKLLSRPLRLSRIHRIQQGRDFARLKARGRRLVNGCVVVNCLPSGETSLSRLGVITSRKVGNAVVRSRARRLLREAWRRHQHDFTQPQEIVLVARPSIAGMKLVDVERDYLQALRRGGVLKANESGPTTGQA